MAAWPCRGRRGCCCSAARFTHVVDNSIIYRRLRAWADAEAGTIRLHSPDIAFYVQSALESAQLLLLALTGAERGEFRVLAITDLGWPVTLLDLALGVLAASAASRRRRLLQRLRRRATRRCPSPACTIR